MSLRTLFSILLLAIFIPIATAQDSKPAAAEDGVAAADALYKTGKLEEAAKGYESLLSSDPKLFDVRAGLMRTRLRQQRVDDAYELGEAGLAMPYHTSELVSAMGDVQFRRAEMREAEASYLRALRLDPSNFRARLGLSKLYRSYSLYRQAYNQLKAAYELAPKDAEVQRAWFPMLPRKERLKSIEEYLSSARPDDPDETTWLKQYADFLKATVNTPIHACRLVSKVEQTQAPLTLVLVDPTHVRGLGLQVKLNDRGGFLLLDTGAGGIMVSRRLAEKAGLERITNLSYVGVGDKGLQTGYSAVAKRIRIGELEFADCVVDVADRLSGADADGIIGANVMSSYLIDIDGPGEMLRLSPLPKRPEEAVKITALRADGDDSDEDEDMNANAIQDTPKTAEMRLPKDRYIAQEMAGWTRVFRFGPSLLIPTHVNDSPSMLFVIDTGAFNNLISSAAARKVGKIYDEDRIQIKGASGAVDQVYSTGRVKLLFSHFAQHNQELFSFDLSNLSRHFGTELSGMLGFGMLRTLELKIDYRDGLVDFVYDPKRVPVFLR